MADDYNNGPVWHRPGSGIENEPDSNWETETTGNLYGGFSGGVNGDDRPPQDVNYDTQPDPFQGRYGSASNQYDQIPGYDTAQAAAQEAQELAYYFAKGRGTGEPSARLVNMTATGKGFNFAAFFFGFFYLIYRKLYLEAAIAYGLAFVLTLVTNNQSTNFVVTLAVSVAFGLLFPFLYHNKMEKKIDDAVKLNKDIRTYLMNTGGTNIILPVILVALYFVLVFFTAAM